MRDLPRTDGKMFLTDGGIETYLIFERGLELPEFSAFTLLGDDAGTAELRAYYEPFLELAAERGAGFVLESPTWRANPRWAARIGYDEAALARLTERAMALMAELRDAYADRIDPIVISGCVGPHDDGYAPGETLTAEAAERYHATQIGTLAGTSAELVTAITMTYVEEAIGVARAAAAAGLPAVISFTTETDGRLPSGQPLGEAIAAVDAATDPRPVYYMINCAHPAHFADVLEGPWTERIAGVRANASTKSHAELDEATELDPGDPDDLARRYAELRAALPRLTVLGGCCGTDSRHLAAIAAA